MKPVAVLETEAIDRAHSDSVAAVWKIRQAFAAMHADVARWEPRPCPPARRWL